jgi:hypothetical protein
MYPGPLPPTACHDKVAWLLGLGEEGPTGRFFWMGAELPMFPDLTGLRYEEGVAPEAHFAPFERVQGDPVDRGGG